MNWHAIAIGAGLAALAAVLQYAQTLPAPYGAIASGLAVVVATFLPQPHKAPGGGS